MASTKKSTKKPAAKKAVVKAPAAKKPAPRPTFAKVDSTKAAAPKKAVAVKASTSGYALEDGIDKPARSRYSTPSPYPFESMVVGQSFFVPAAIERALYTSEKEADEAQREETARVANRMSGATRRFTKRNVGVTLSVRTVENGVRVWRDK